MGKVFEQRLAALMDAPPAAASEAAPRLPRLADDEVEQREQQRKKEEEDKEVLKGPAGVMIIISCFLGLFARSKELAGGKESDQINLAIAGAIISSLAWMPMCILSIWDCDWAKNSSSDCSFRLNLLCLALVMFAPLIASYRPRMLSTRVRMSNLRTRLFIGSCSRSP